MGNVIHMSKWTHSICLSCWQFREGARVPVRVKLPEDDPADICCYCGRPTTEGIYNRMDPNSPSLLCKGAHDE